MCNNHSADVTELRWKSILLIIKKNLNMHTVAVEDQLYLEDDIFSDSVWHFLSYFCQATENDFNASKCHLSIFLMQLICNRVPTKIQSNSIKTKWCFWKILTTLTVRYVVSAEWALYHLYYLFSFHHISNLMSSKLYRNDRHEKLPIFYLWVRPKPMREDIIYVIIYVTCISLVMVGYYICDLHINAYFCPQSPVTRINF